MTLVEFIARLIVMLILTGVVVVTVLLVVFRLFDRFGRW